MTRELNKRGFAIFDRFQLTIRRRLILGNITIGFLILLAAFISVQQINRLAEASTASQQAHEQHTTVLEVNQHSAEMIAVVSRLLLVEDAAVFEDEVSSALDSLQRSEQELKKLLGSTQENEEVYSLLFSVHDNVESVISISETMIRQANDNQWPSVRVRVGVLVRDEQQLMLGVNQLTEIAEEAAEVATAEVALARQAATIIPAVALLVSLLLGMLLLWQTMQSIARPVERLSEGVMHLTAGSLDERIVVENTDELGRLAGAFNIMADQLQASYTRLEERVAERTQALQTSAEVSRSLSTILDRELLISEVLRQLQADIRYYHAQIFLFEEADQNILRMVAGTGDAGQAMLKVGHSIPKGVGLVGRAAEENQPILVPDVSKNVDWVSNALLPNTKAEASVPIALGGEVLGVLDVQHDVVDGLDQDDADLFQSIASQVAITLQNARLYAQTEAQLNETENLLNLNTLLTTTLDVNEIYRRAARAFTELLGVSHCAISSWEREGNTLLIQAEFMHDVTQGTITQVESERSAYDLTEHMGTQQLLRTHEALVRHVDAPELEASERKVLRKLGQATSLEVPLVVGTEAVGIVELFRNGNQSPFGSREVQLAQAMANQTAIALNNAMLTTEARERVAQLSTINRLSILLSLAPTLKDVFVGMRRELFSMVEAVGISIMLLTPEKDTLEWIYGFEYGEEVDLSNIPPLPITQGFSGYVVRRREALLINEDVEKMQEVFQSQTVGVSPAAWLGLPLIVANELIGIVAIENNEPFSEYAVELLKTVAGPLAIAIHNLIQFEEVQVALEAQSQQRVQLQTAAEVAATATSSLKPDELMQQSVDLIKERFNLYYVGLFLVDPGANQAVLRAGTGEVAQDQIAQERKLSVGGRSLIGGATADGIPRITQDVSEDEEWLPNPHLPETRSELALPLRVRGNIIGAVSVQSDSPNAFSPELISTLQTMSDQLAVAIENAQLLAKAEARAQHQQRLNQISAQLYRSTDVNEIVGIGLRALSERLAGAKVELTLGRPEPINDEGEGRTITDTANGNE